MSSKILTIKDWAGSGTNSLKLDIGSYMLIEKNVSSKQINKLVVNRKADSHSSRFGMMASLNAQNHTLGWGFPEMTLTVDKTSDQGKFISRQIFVFSSIGVESSQVSGGEEETTFVCREKSELCFGQC